MRRILLAMVVALVGVMTLPAAADATPRPNSPDSFPFCLPYVEQFAGPPRIVWDCRPIPLAERTLPPGWPDPPPFPPCPCPFAIELNLNAVLPAGPASMAMSRIHEGFYYLGAAAVTSDPGQAAQWHNTAMNAFTTAARMLGGRALPAARGGFFDRARNAFLPAPYPGPQLAVDYLRNGMTLLQQWLVTQNPQLWDLVVPQLDNAYTAMTQYS